MIAKILLIFFSNFTKEKKVLSALVGPSQQPTVLFSIYQNNTWTIRRLVHEMINEKTQRPSNYIGDCRIFKPIHQVSASKQYQP